MRPPIPPRPASGCSSSAPVRWNGSASPSTTWPTPAPELAVVEDRMGAVLDALRLTALVTSIRGLTVVGAAAILAETGDPRRFSSARALVKHAGLCPRD